jgi:porin
MITMKRLFNLVVVLLKHDGEDNRQHWLGIASVLSIILLGFTSHALAVDINEKLSIGGVMGGAYQYQSVNNTDADNAGRGGLSIQPEISYRPTDKNELFAKFGFAAGNGLNEISPFVLAPWAAPMENDVKDINGRNRDYLLTAWYKHTFQFGESASLGLTGGLIDATDYLDENAFSNDEFTQFMNEALVNGPNVFAPSFDIGGAAELDLGNFSVRGVIMDIGENDDGNSYHFYGVQLGYMIETSLGEGNYRLIVNGTSKEFFDIDGEDKERKVCVILSFDQQLGDIFGAWIRVGKQDDKAAVDCGNLLSGGINISGQLWGREDDNFGIGYAYINGGNTDLDSSQVAEAYVRFALDEYVALTLDVQYLQDKYDDADDPNGFIYGLRLACEF